MYFLTEREEYDYCTNRGFEPLLDIVNFKMDISLRIEVQKEIFGHTILGRGNIPQGNDRFFRWVWSKKKHYCEETMRPLGDAFRAIFCSHILTRGANPDIAHDPRNINILCADMHHKWEEGNRREMRIYPANVKIIELLKSEYRVK